MQQAAQLKRCKNGGTEHNESDSDQKMQSTELIIEPSAPSQETEIGRINGIASPIKYAIAFVFGCLLGLSSPGFDQWYWAWFGLIPLLVLIRSAAGRLEAGLIGFYFGFGYYLVGLSFYLGLYPLNWFGLADWLGIQAAAALWLIESVHQSILFFVFALFLYCLPTRAGLAPWKSRPFFPYAPAAALIFVFLTWVIGCSPLFLGIPINQLGYSQSGNLALLQMTKYLGGGCLDFLIVLVNAVGAQLLIYFSDLTAPLADRLDRFSPKVGGVIDAAIVLFLLFVLHAFGMQEIYHQEYALHISNLSNFDGSAKVMPHVPIAVLQGNVSVEEDRLHTSSQVEIAKRYGDLSTNLGVSLLFYPEAALNLAENNASLLLDKLQSLSASEKKEIIVGAIEKLNGGRVKVARLLSFRPLHDPPYVKQRLIPFAEFTPLGDVGKHIAGAIEQELPQTRPDFLAAAKSRLLATMWGKAGVAIGAEIIYPHLISDAVRHGACLIVNLSDLSLFHRSSLNKQLLAAAVFRAVENNKYIVVASNTGASAVIDPAGMITCQSLSNKRGILMDTVQFIYGRTFFSGMWWL